MSEIANTEEQQPAKRGRGRPRKYPAATPKQPPTTEDFATWANKSWENRRPQYRRPKCITLAPDVFDVLDADRNGRTWSEYLCDLKGIPRPPDRRRGNPQPDRQPE